VSVAWLAFALSMTLGTTAAVMLGQVGPGSEVVLHHNTLVQQIPAARGALLSMRGVAEFPSDDQLRLQFDVTDGMLEATTASARAEHVIDESGKPVLAGRFGLGTRQAFAAEAIVDETWLDVTRHGRNVRIANRSDATLHDCRFGEGMSAGRVGELTSQQVVEAIQVRDTTGPLFTCTTSAPAVRFLAADRHVALVGTTTIAIYSARPGAATLGTPND
jgi:hypothetical protein